MPQSAAAALQSQAFDGLLEFGRHYAALTTIRSFPAHQGCQPDPAILRNQPMCSPIWDSGGACHRRQRLVPLKVRLEQLEPLHRSLSCLFRQTRQLVHTQRICQIMLTAIMSLNVESDNLLSGG